MQQADVLFGGSGVDQALEYAKGYKRVYFRPNPGNAGDALINVGFYSCAERCGLEYAEITTDFDYSCLDSEDLVILSGGGNIVPYWEAGSELIVELTKYQFPLLLMPQSVEGREEILRLLRPKDILLLREEYSFEYAKSLGLECSIGLDHDLAFSVNAEDILKSFKLPPLRGRNIRKMLYILFHFIRSRFFGDLKALRTDRESRFPGKKRKINDVSSLARFGTGSKELNYCSSYWMLKILSWYKVIETDRLHVFVACSLLGKQVVLHSNSYHKIKGVYNYSINGFAERAEKVVFVG